MVVAAARYTMPPPGAMVLQPLVISEEQQPVPLGDEHNGEPGQSSLRWEGQGVCMRPGTDVYLSGHAWAPRGQLATRVLVSVGVGPCRREATVFGDRRWGVSGASAPVAFEKIPLVYERCFGGLVEGARGSTAKAIERNPVGRGIYVDPDGQLLPNIEDPQRLIASPQHKPPPQGFGPIARHWMPRRGLAGTYDQAWVENRAPLWPPDFDPMFFLAASPGLQAVPHLRGGEDVALVGVHPDGPLRFTLPPLRLVAKFRFADKVVRRMLVLDALMLEPDVLGVTLIFRASVVVAPTMLALESTTLRLLEDWEELAPS